jgi:antitoxin component YwqK of YwqJK toxin-antitoxin module
MEMEKEKNYYYNGKLEFEGEYLKGLRNGKERE